MTSARATGTRADYAAPDADRFAARRGDGTAPAFWKKARRVAAQLPFAETCSPPIIGAFRPRDTNAGERRRWWARSAYFVLPFDFVPDVLRSGFAMMRRAGDRAAHGGRPHAAGTS